MRRSLAVALLILACLAVVSAESGRRQRPSAKPHARTAGCGGALDYQVRLDRLGFSPGEIDGSFGRNTRLAIRAFQEAGGIEPTGKPGCATWRALTAKDAEAGSLTDYGITDDDASIKLVDRIPSDLMEQARLDSLGFTSLPEALGEKFHSAPSLLRRLNPKASFAAGETIRVPNLVSAAAQALAPNPSTPTDLVIEVTRERSALRVLAPGGTVVFVAPVTVGSTHDPLPIGDWAVTDVTWDPVFHYNPELFWDADPSHAKATIKAGPNNPVGVVWIGLTVPHYGIHGTPEPSLVGHAASHGCVRLTNWDATRVGRLARRDMKVVFR